MRDRKKVKTIRLIFWVDKKVVSKFVSPLIPNIGEIWRVPKGAHNYEEEEGWIYVRVIEKGVSPDFSGDSISIDVNLICEYTPSGWAP